MSKLAKYLISDIQNDWLLPSIKFFRSNNIYGYIMWLTIINYYFKKELVSIELIVKSLEKYASRRTVLSFINRGVGAGYIIKKNDISDMRKTFIEPSEITIQEYEDWSKEFIKNVI